MSRRGYLPPEQIAAARRVPLLDYLQQRGYALKKEGRYYRLEEHDSIVIDVDRNRWYWNSRGIKNANTLEFLMEYEGLPLIEAALELTEGGGWRPLSERERRDHLRRTSAAEFRLPEENEDERRVFAYLVHTRGVDAGLVQKCVAEGLLYESAKTHNAVFVRRKDGRAVGCFERGTCSFGEPYKHCPPGSDKRYEFLLPGRKQETLFVCEAAIDCLAVETLRQMRGAPSRDAPVLSLGGNSLPALEQYLKDYPQTHTVAVCTDNDEGGETAWQRMQPLHGDGLTFVRCAPPDPYKDWDDLLVAVRQNRCPPELADILILKER